MEPAVFQRNINTDHDQQSRTSHDESLLIYPADSLCSGLLAERDLGYRHKPNPKDSRLAGSFRGRHGAMAGSMEPVCPDAPDRKYIHFRQALLSRPQRNVAAARLAQSSLVHQVDNTIIATITSGVKRDLLVETYSRRIVRGKYSSGTRITTTSTKSTSLGDFEIGEAEAFSNARVHRFCEAKHKSGDLAIVCGTSGGHASVAPQRRRVGDCDSYLPHCDWPISTLAANQESGLAQAVTVQQSLVTRRESRTASKRFQELQLLRVVGKQQNKTAASVVVIERPESVNNKHRRNRTVKIVQPSRLSTTDFYRQTTTSPKAAAGATKGSEEKQHESLKKTTGRSEIKASATNGSPNNVVGDTKSASRNKITQLTDNEGNQDRDRNEYRMDSAWDNFFHARTTNLRTAAALRAAYAFVVVVNLLLLSLDLDWFLRVMPTPRARRTMDPDTLTVLTLFTDTVFWPKVCVYLWMTHAVLLGLGIAPRLQAFAVFFYQCQVTQHNSCLWNGEDIVMRLLAFFLIFFPNRYSAIDMFRKRNTIRSHPAIKSWPMWPFRLVQIQMCLIYFSTGGLKWGGRAWNEGYAMYQVVHNDALYGMWFNPDWMFGYTRPLRLLTHVTVWYELAIIPMLWFPATRKKAILGAIMFHVSLAITMNLNMFHWIMIVGWCSFFIQPSLPAAEIR